MNHLTNAHVTLGAFIFALLRMIMVGENFRELCHLIALGCTHWQKF